MGAAMRNRHESWWLRQTQSKNSNDAFLREKKNQNRKSTLYRDLLIKQHQMNQQAWDVLQNNGVNDNDEFCLNFKFKALNQTCGETLKDFISVKTDYTVHTTSEGYYKKSCIIQGATMPVKISKEMIDRWVSEMIKLGLEYNCNFSGWWIWKYDNFACPDVVGIRRNIGTIPERKPRLIERLITIIYK